MIKYRKVTLCFFSLFFFSVSLCFAEGEPVGQSKNPFMAMRDGKLRVFTLGVSGSERELCIDESKITDSPEKILDPSKGKCFPVVLTNYELNKLLKGCDKPHVWLGEKACSVILTHAKEIQNAKGMEQSQLTRERLVSALEEFKLEPKDSKMRAWEQMIRYVNNHLQSEDELARHIRGCIRILAPERIKNKDFECDEHTCASKYPTCFQVPSARAQVEEFGDFLKVTTWNTQGTGKKFMKRYPIGPLKSYLREQGENSNVR